MARPRRSAVATLQPPPMWEPAPGFVPLKPGVWVPENYVQQHYEVEAPAVSNMDEAMCEYDRCQRSLAYFAIYHCWSLHVDDPITKVTVWRKFPNYPYIRKLFRELQYPRNTLIEKSRQMLLSWAMMVTFLWDILFHRNWGNFVLSFREEEVDDGGEASTHETLLGKVRTVHTTLPPYLRDPLDIRYLMIRNPSTNSFIRGSSAAMTAGRSRAVKRALMDEAAHIEHSETIFKGLTEAAKQGLYLVSNPNGKDNVFYRIRANPLSAYRKITVHWSEHPEKAEGLYCTCGWKSVATTKDADGKEPHEQFAAHTCANLTKTPPTGPEMRSPWYDQKVLDMTPEGVASELDISYERSRRGRVFATFDTRRQVFAHQDLFGVGERRKGEELEEYRQRYLQGALRHGRQAVVGWDFGIDDACSLVLGQVEDESLMKIRWLDTFEDNNHSWDYYHAFVTGAWAPVVRHVTGTDILHYGDPSGTQRQSDLLSWIINLRNAKPKIVVIHQPQRGEYMEWIDFVHNIIRKGHFEVSSWAQHLIDGLGNWAYPTDEKGEIIPGKHKPVHDKWSHVMTAMIYVYKFRWAARLTDPNRTLVTNRQILGVDGDLPPAPRPPVDSAPAQPKRLKYFTE